MLFESQLESNLSLRQCTPLMYTPEYLEPAEITFLGGQLEKVIEIIQTTIDRGRLLGCPSSMDLDEAECLLDRVRDQLAMRPPLDCVAVCADLLAAYRRATVDVTTPGPMTRCL